jgi:heme exporter protein B
LVALLILPFEVPALMFGVYAINLAIDGSSVAGPMYLLSAMLVLALTLGPLAMAAAIRIGIES